MLEGRRTWWRTKLIDDDKVGKQKAKSQAHGISIRRFFSLFFPPLSLSFSLSFGVASLHQYLLVTPTALPGDELPRWRNASSFSSNTEQLNSGPLKKKKKMTSTVGVRSSEPRQRSQPLPLHCGNIPFSALNSAPSTSRWRRANTGK